MRNKKFIIILSIICAFIFFILLFTQFAKVFTNPYVEGTKTTLHTIIMYKYGFSNYEKRYIFRFIIKTILEMCGIVFIMGLLFKKLVDSKKTPEQMEKRKQNKLARIEAKQKKLEDEKSKI